MWWCYVLDTLSPEHCDWKQWAGKKEAQEGDNNLNMGVYNLLKEVIRAMSLHFEK